MGASRTFTPSTRTIARVPTATDDTSSKAVGLGSGTPLGTAEEEGGLFDGSGGTSDGIDRSPGADGEEAVVPQPVSKTRAAIMTGGTGDTRRAAMMRVSTLLTAAALRG